MSPPPAPEPTTQASASIVTAPSRPAGGPGSNGTIGVGSSVTDSMGAR